MKQDRKKTGLTYPATFLITIFDFVFYFYDAKLHKTNRDLQLRQSLVNFSLLT